MEGAPLHCSRRPWTRHGPWGPLIHHGCPRPRIYHGRLNSLPRFLKPKVLSLPLVSPFPLGPSLGQLSLLRPGGRLSRLLRPGGRLSRLLRPGGRLICQSHPTSPSTCQSHPTSPSTCQSHPTSPSTCQSRPTSPSTCQSRPTSPSTCQSRPTPPSTCQSRPTDLPESPHWPARVAPRLRRPARVAPRLRRPARVAPRLRRPARVAPRLRRPARVAPRLRRPARVAPRLRRPARVAPRLRRPARVASRLRRPARVTSRPCCLVRPALVGSCFIGPTWTWPSVPSPGSTSAPPPSWILLCVSVWKPLLGGGLCHESGSHSLKLHITHGLHFPSCTALTHSRPPLHQSHSCHHSLINSDCLTTPAPHSLTHIKAAHKHSPSAKSCFPLANILSVILPAISVFDPGLPELGTLNLCLWPRPLPGIVYVSALPLIFLFLPADHCPFVSASAQ